LLLTEKLQDPGPEENFLLALLTALRARKAPASESGRYNSLLQGLKPDLLKKGSTTLLMPRPKCSLVLQLKIERDGGDDITLFLH